VRASDTAESIPMKCPYCSAGLDGDGTCERCGSVRTPSPLTGWRPDPTARHEGRYYVGGRPTARVRNGKSETTDAVGGRKLPDYVEVPAARPSIRSTWLGTTAVTAIIVMITAVAWVLVDGRRQPSPEAGYLAMLKDAGLKDQFNSDANAIAHGRQVCRQLDDGGPQQGVPADRLAVDAFCPQFTDGFRVLESAEVSGILVLRDSAQTGAIATDGPSCEGAYGFSDVGQGTQVIVRNGKGEILAATALDQGKTGTAVCTFSFGFPVTDGQDHYIVSVGSRGEFSYSFDQLLSRGVQIHLGR
jgi:Protein of unknown function (DUF732)